MDLMRETITIVRRPVVDSDFASLNESLRIIETDPVEPTNEISLSLKREEPVIVQKPYVKKEVIVKKKPIVETKTITKEVTHEEIRKI
jgi:stress response protein YsnF